MVRIKKPFQLLKQGDELNAIVCFTRRPWVYSQKSYSVGKCERVVVQYKYFLRIDLWLFTLDFNWEYPRNLK